MTVMWIRKVHFVSEHVVDGYITVSLCYTTPTKTMNSNLAQAFAHDNCVSFPVVAARPSHSL